MVKIAAISDTHTQHYDVLIPQCDLLIHSGDFSYVGKMLDVLELNRWFGNLKQSGLVKEIVMVAGNHDWICETNPSWVKESFTNCIYLDEESAEVMGIKVFGSAITPEFNSWAFNRYRGEEIARNWSKIPEDTELLITHGPPFGILDKLEDGTPVGCEELLKRVQKLPKLKLHCFGHIHGDYGRYTDPSGKLFINAAICNEQYQPVNSPQIIDL